MTPDVLVQIRDVVGYKDLPYAMPLQVHELFSDFCDIAKIEKDCVENCRFIHRQPEEHEQIVWRTYTSKWSTDGLSNLQIVELKGLYQKWKDNLWTTKQQALLPLPL
jgi:hypothetical protein